MSLYEVDRAATQARLDAITADGLRKLGESARRSEEIDKQTQAMFARQEREKQAMDELVKQARQAKGSGQPGRPAPKPATLALGGEEFREARDRRIAEPGTAPQQAPPAQATSPRPGSQTWPQGMPDRPASQQNPSGHPAPLNAPGRPAPQNRPGQQYPPSRPVPQNPAGPPASQPPAGPAADRPTPRPASDPPAGPPPRRTLMLGAPEDREQEQHGTEPAKEPAKERPKPRRRPPAETDDDMSGRTWLR